MDNKKVEQVAGTQRIRRYLEPSPIVLVRRFQPKPFLEAGSLRQQTACRKQWLGEDSAIRCGCQIIRVIQPANLMTSAKAPLVVEDAKFPGMKSFPLTFSLFDEVYQIKDCSRKDVRVLLSLDAGKLDLTRKGVKRTDNDFAVIWAKNFGKGRVLYNGLGHVPALWERSDFQKMWLEMVQWSMGLIPGDATPQPKPGK